MRRTTQTSFLDVIELERLGFKYLGTNVLVSRKASIYGASEIELGNNIRIDDFCVLSGGSGLKTGDYVHISSFSALFAGSGIILDDFVTVSARVTLFSESDDYSGASLTNPTVPLEFKPGYKRGRILIRRHCIVGANSTILPGVTLNEGVAVGAHSLVVEDCSEWSIYAGVPARRIKDRSRELLDFEQLFRSAQTLQ
jgi:dTDP-4-amino-4,6-dideoxy-D-glucose acyltransferase